MSRPFPSLSSSNDSTSSGSSGSAPEKKQFDKQTTCNCIQGIGLSFRNSWRRKESEYKTTKKSNSMAGMVEFVGLIKVNVVRGTRLVIRDMMTSDPYVVFSLGNESVKTHVIKNNVNSVWNQQLMLSIPDHVPPLKLLVYDKDIFTNDDFMGEAEIDTQPLVFAAKASESSAIQEYSTQLGTWKASKENTLVRDGFITLIDGRVNCPQAAEC